MVKAKETKKDEEVKDTQAEETQVDPNTPSEIRRTPSEEKEKEVKVRFVKHCTPYAEGDIAGVPASHAEQYIDKGYAVKA